MVRKLVVLALLMGCHKNAAPEAPVVISEIMYHPVMDDDPAVSHEFIELENRTDQEIDLGGWQLGGGIRFKFAAGTRLPARAFLVVAKNRQKLLADVPSYKLDAARVTGDYDGELDNGGEKITLSDADGDRVDEVFYDDAFPWPVSADALGAGDDWLAP